MKNINEWTLYNILALFDDSDVCALAKDIIDENGFNDIDDYSDTEAGIHVTVWARGAMSKSYAFRAAAIGFRSTTEISAEISAKINHASITIYDSNNDQFLTIYFEGGLNNES